MSSVAALSLLSWCLFFAPHSLYVQGTQSPTLLPTVEPTFEPTAEPTFVPTIDPTSTSTSDLSASGNPSASPSEDPTAVPTPQPISTTLQVTKPDDTSSVLDHLIANPTSIEFISITSSLAFILIVCGCGLCIYCIRKRRRVNQAIRIAHTKKMTFDQIWEKKQGQRNSGKLERPSTLSNKKQKDEELISERKSKDKREVELPIISKANTKEFSPRNERKSDGDLLIKTHSEIEYNRSVESEDDEKEEKSISADLFGEYVETPMAETAEQQEADHEPEFDKMKSASIISGQMTIEGQGDMNAEEPARENEMITKGMTIEEDAEMEFDENAKHENENKNETKGRSEEQETNPKEEASDHEKAENEDHESDGSQSEAGSDASNESDPFYDDQWAVNKVTNYIGISKPEDMDIIDNDQPTKGPQGDDQRKYGGNEKFSMAVDGT